MIRRVPIIVVLGSTGTGKTKLSLEIAERIGGEIISADSMQVYPDLNIVTAKATLEEQAKVKHHLLNIGHPLEPFTVVQFRNAALPIIDDLLSKSKCPIVVGGTNYYIESLLWDILVSSHNFNGQQFQKQASSSINISEVEFERLTSERLYQQLKKIDPVTAERIHPNNKRKILRAIEVYSQTGIPLSDILQMQRNKPGGNRLGGPLRYPHTILLWLQCNQDILNKRLDKRVDDMVKQGLLKEIRSFYEKHYIQYDNTSKEAFTKGVLQTIGFKEFVPYLKQFSSSHDVILEKYLKEHDFNFNELQGEPPELKIFRQCLEQLKLVTKQYSKKQIKWIKNRFLACKDRQVSPIYALNTSNVDMWETNVLSPAFNIIESYITNKVPTILPLDPLEHPSYGLNEETSNFCSICNRYFVGEFQWQIHLKSNKHQKRMQGKRRENKREGDDLKAK